MKQSTLYPPPVAARILGNLEEQQKAGRLARLDPAIRKDLETILSFPPDTAGRLMDNRVATFRRDATAGETLRRLRKQRMKTARSLFLVDEGHHLVGKVTIEDVPF